MNFVSKVLTCIGLVGTFAFFVMFVGTLAPKPIAEGMSYRFADALLEHQAQTVSDSMQASTSFQKNLTEAREVISNRSDTDVVVETRVFSGSNAVAFALIALLGFFGVKTGIAPITGIAILGIAAYLTGHFYLFSQDWADTLAKSDFVGYEYPTYLLITAIFVWDAICNEFELIIDTISSIFDAIGSAISSISF